MSSPVSHYQYDPSQAMAGIGAAIFTAIALGSVFRAWQVGATVMVPFLIGVILEAGGHIARAISAQDTHANNPYLVAYLTPIVAPSYLAAGLYMVFGRTLTLITPQSRLNFRTLWIGPRLVTPLFVGVDIISFLIQLMGIAGVARAVSADPKDVNMDQLKNGLSALKLGLIIQMMCFIVFGLLVGRFWMVSRPWLKQRALGSPQQARGINRLMIIMVTCAVLLMLRGIYRVFEFTQEVNAEPGADRYLILNEWPFWVLDALPMAAVEITFGILHTLSVFPSILVKFRVKRAKAAVYGFENDQRYQSEEHDQTYQPEASGQTYRPAAPSQMYRPESYKL